MLEAVENIRNPIETVEDIRRRLEKSAHEMYEYLRSLGCDQPPMNVVFPED